MNLQTVGTKNGAVSTPEFYVSPERAAEFLGFGGKYARKKVLRMARLGLIPAHPLLLTGKRRQWRFKLSELDSFVQGINIHPPVRQ